MLVSEQAYEAEDTVVVWLTLAWRGVDHFAGAPTAKVNDEG